MRPFGIAFARGKTMTPDGSVTQWLTDLKAGDEAAAQPLWERYYRRLIGLAREKLRTAHRREADEEDAVQSAFHSFFRGVEAGRFPQLDDRDNLWRLLVVITARKALNQIARERARRRGGGTLRSESLISSSGNERSIEQIVGDEPTPEFAAEVAEEYCRMLDMLDDESLQRVAVWKMEGYSNDEIASKLECSLRTVARKLETIRIIWKSEAE